MPAHVYAPYFETWTADTHRPTSPARPASSYFTLAFLETTCARPRARSPGTASGRQTGRQRPVPADIATLRAVGGDVIPSFGGWSADQGGTEIGDSCKNVNSIVAAYRVGRHDVRRHPARHGHRGPVADEDRRHRPPQQGDHAAPDWATANGRPLTIPYTLPTSRIGPRGERARRPPERDGERRPDRHRQADGLRLLRPRRRRDMGAVGDQRR